ncbi:MAG: hypothetical protein HZA50_04055 [Planctomycetes bacterium]|nr:hypothetical protein [Planctomycetota bacterium]
MSSSGGRLPKSPGPAGWFFGGVLLAIRQTSRRLWGVIPHRKGFLADHGRILRDGTRIANRLIPPPADGTAGSRGTALVLMLRGPGYVHMLHNYLVACAMRSIGYSVKLVVCDGATEACGLVQDRTSRHGPPAACPECKRVAAMICADGFEVVKLGRLRIAGEDDDVRRAKTWPAEELERLDFGGVNVMSAMRPFMIRYFSGDIRKITGADEAVRSHAVAAAGFIGRFRKLIDDYSPRCVCMFNGLFFPECLLMELARQNGITTLATERGMRKNTFFLSLDAPACHYRNDRLWEAVKHSIGPEQIAQARRYMQGRLAGPLDPTGKVRDVAAAGDSAQSLRQPYVLFFAPVTHDTASMVGGNCVSGVWQAMEFLCRAARRSGVRLVIRSHPDEWHPVNPSSLTVMEYLRCNNLLDSGLIECLDPARKWNPYELARNAAAVVIYNGTLGMELPALGCPVCNIADSHYAGKGFTIDLARPEDFDRPFAGEKPSLDAAAVNEALRYLYYYVNIAGMDIWSIMDEYEPFTFRIARADDGPRRGQLDDVVRRVRLLVGNPDEGLS